MKNKLLWFFLGIMVTSLVFWLAGPLFEHPSQKPVAPHVEKTKQLWTCGMHPEVIQDEPGQCPICGMDLVPVKTESPEKLKEKKGKGKILFYKNPMDPTITSPVPMKDEMGMDYIPVYESDVAGAVKEGTAIQIDPGVVQNMNVVTEKVQRRDVKYQIRTVGYLTYDQEKVVSITTKYEGWVEKTYVNYEGERVKKGQPLLEIYSPALVQTEKELIAAANYVKEMKEASPDAQAQAQSLLEAALERLGYWDIPSDQVKAILETGTILRTLTITAPTDGLVIERMEGLEGMAVRPGMVLMKLVDLSTLWIDVELYENQIPWVHLGDPARITLDYFPGETFQGKVQYVETEVDPKTRTLKVSLQVPNPQKKLRAGMYATVYFEPVVAQNALTVPTYAVISTGLRNVVIVSKEEGRFAPREVVLGPEGDGFVVIKEGLMEGEAVVVNGQFLLDSESQLREAILKMVAHKEKAQGDNHAQ